MVGLPFKLRAVAPLHRNHSRTTKVGLPFKLREVVPKVIKNEKNERWFYSSN